MRGIGGGRPKVIEAPGVAKRFAEVLPLLQGKKISLVEAAERVGISPRILGLLLKESG